MATLGKNPINTHWSEKNSDSNQANPNKLSSSKDSQHGYQSASTPRRELPSQHVEESRAAWEGMGQASSFYDKARKAWEAKNTKRLANQPQKEDVYVKETTSQPLNLSNVQVREIMTRNPKSVQPDVSVQQVAQLMVDYDCGIIPVTDETNKLLGVVTDRDIVCRLVALGLDLKSAQVRNVMSVDIECVTENDSLYDVLYLMSESQIRRVPVVAEGDRLVGIIAMSDIARETSAGNLLAHTLEQISTERSFWSRIH